jgi:DNA repair ATPase RecN
MEEIVRESYELVERCQSQINDYVVALEIVSIRLRKLDRRLFQDKKLRLMYRLIVNMMDKTMMKLIDNQKLIQEFKLFLFDIVNLY